MIGNWQHWYWQQFHIGNIKQNDHTAHFLRRAVMCMKRSPVHLLGIFARFVSGMLYAC